MARLKIEILSHGMFPREFFQRLTKFRSTVLMHKRKSSLRLSPGRHRLEVVRPGYRTVEREVEVEPGRGAEIEIEMEKL